MTDGNGSTGIVSVMTLNLRFGLADDGPNSWPNRKAALASVLTTHRSDFYGFQEANDFQIAYIKKVLPEYGMIGQRLPAPRFWQNNVIFYSKAWKCVRSKRFFLSPTPSIPSRARNSKWPRQCTMGVFEYHGRSLTIGATHFDFDAEVQAQSAGILLNQLSRFSNTPAIIMGDFNADPHSPCHRVFSGGESGTPPGGGPVFSNAFSPPYPCTFHGFSGKKDGPCIDWILYRGLGKVESAVIDSRFSGFYPSDHFPVRASFSFLLA